MDNQSYGEMLHEDGEPELVFGADVGAPRKWGDQQRKLILIEACRITPKVYEVEAVGRNERLLSPTDASKPNLGRPGWAWPELRDSLINGAKFSVGAFDFPFSIPIELLSSPIFANCVGRAVPFNRRLSWQRFVASKISLSYGPGGTMNLQPLEPWRDKVFWVRRATDQATNGQPPLKHKFQNLFAMTVAGASLLHALSEGGIRQIRFLSRSTLIRRPAVFETYPGHVARSIGFIGSYKKNPSGCMNRAEAYLASKGIKLTVSPVVKNFCEEYRSGSGKNKTDPDGADAFLCLVAAICFREGFAVHWQGRRTGIQLRQEACIISPN